MQPPPALQTYQFGDFELDTRRRLLTTRADGREVEITGRVLDALIYLVERPGQLIEKKALMDALWPHVVVEEGNLTQTVHTLRKVLGEAPGDHRYIATVAGRGYRFVAEVHVRDRQAVSEPTPAPSPTPTPAPASSPPPARRTKIVLGAIALSLAVLALIALLVTRSRDRPIAAATPPSIAVLAFVDMSAEQNQAHFADGLSEEILNALAQSKSLRVIARTSSFSFRDRDVDIRTIAQRLDVTHVLEGSVRKSGDRIRITAQLIDASDSAHIWSDTFDRNVNDIFGVQREIAASVADALHVSLGPAAPSRAETTSTEAYEYYLQGRHLFNRRSGGDLVQAKANFEKATQRDPDYARAWSALAGVYLVETYENVELPDAMENWRKAAERARMLAPDSAEAQFRAAQYYLHANDVATAQKLVDRAAALDPREPLVVGRTISHALTEGRTDDAVALQKELVARDPLSAIQRGNLGYILILANRLPEAQSELERALEMTPAGPGTVMGLADVLILQGRTDEALTVINRIPAGFQKDQRLAIAHFARGEADQGEVMLKRVIALAEKPEVDPDLFIAIAEVNAARKQTDEAFAWLDRGYRHMESRPGVLPRMLMLEDIYKAVYLLPLHEDPRWKALAQSLGARKP